MPCIAIDPALALLEVHWIRRCVPMNDRVTPAVEVDALLPNARRGEDEWPERAVERFAHLRHARVVFGLALAAVPQSEPAAEPDRSPIGVERIERAVLRGSQ